MAESARILMFKPRTGGKRPRRGARARYFYPRQALEQDHFTRGGTGQKYFATLALFMLASDKFESQIALLLSQLTNEGFDVSGPEAEYRAMRDDALTAAKNAQALRNG